MEPSSIFIINDIEDKHSALSLFIDYTITGATFSDGSLITVGHLDEYLYIKRYRKGCDNTYKLEFGTVIPISEWYADENSIKDTFMEYINNACIPASSRPYIRKDGKWNSGVDCSINPNSMI